MIISKNTAFSLAVVSYIVALNMTYVTQVLWFCILFLIFDIRHQVGNTIVVTDNWRI